MFRLPTTRMIAALSTGLALLLSLLAATNVAMAHGVSEGGLSIIHAWTRSVPVAGLNGAGYATISNSSEQGYRLVAVETQAAAETSLHESVLSEQGMTSMKPLPEGVLIPPGKTVQLSPGGVHIMLMKLRSPTKAGEHLPVNFVFEAADAPKDSKPEELRLQTQFVVQPVDGDSHTHH